MTTATPPVTLPLDAARRLYEQAMERLAHSGRKAPESLTDAVMAALPDGPDPRWRDRLAFARPAGRRPWLFPALAGAAAAVLVMSVVSRWRTAGAASCTQC